MNYTITKNGYGMTVEHRGVVAEFLTKKAYPKNAFKDKVFDPVNKYLQLISLDRQDRMFEILNGFSQSVGLGVTVAHVHSSIDEFYELLCVDTILVEWVKDIPIPDKIGNKVENGRNHTTSKTYVISEYMDLMVCVIVMKALVPYIYSITGRLTTHKDYKPIEMVSYLPRKLFTLPWDKKFREYIGTFVTGSSINMDKVVTSGLDDDNVFDWIFSLVLLHKIISAPVLNSTNGSHVITHIHSYVEGKLNPRIPAITAKKLGKTNSQEQADSESDFQAYRSKDALPISYQVEIEHTVSDKYLGGAMLNRFLAPEKHVRYRRLCKSLAKHKFVIIDEMVLLCNWVLSDVVHPKVFDVLKSESLYPVVAFVHLLLEDRHPYISTFLVTNMELNERGAPIPVVGQIGNMKLTPDHIKRLCHMFPIYINKGNVTKETMVAKLAGMLNQITMMSRILACTKSCLNSKTRSFITVGGKFKPTANKRTLVAELLLDLDNLLISRIELPKL